jgi:AraC-like DNA-binding protein
MIALRMAAPCPVLREFVRVFAQRRVQQSDALTDRVIEPIPARLEQTLEFQFGECFNVKHWDGHREKTPQIAIIGAHVHGVTQIELHPGTYSFGVFFRPTGFSRLFGVPVNELANRGYDATSISDQLHRLWLRLAQSATFEQRVAVIECVLLARAARSAKKDKMLSAAEYIFSSHGAIRISHLADETGLSLRQFERRFVQSVGITPKLFARVARFQTALDTKIAAPQRSWLQIAHALHYHDQMHMIHDFQELAGDSPTHLLPRIGDARPSALLSSAEVKIN